MVSNSLALLDKKERTIVDGQTNGLTVEWANKGTDAQTTVQTDKQLNRQTDEWMNRRMDKQTYK